MASRAISYNDGNVLAHILSFAHQHPEPEWTIENHFGECGESCHCCRAAFQEAFGACWLCEDALQANCVNKAWIRVQCKAGMLFRECQASLRSREGRQRAGA